MQYLPKYFKGDRDMIIFKKDCFTDAELDTIKDNLEEIQEGIPDDMDIIENWELIKEANSIELASDIMDTPNVDIHIPGKMTAEEAYIALLWGFCQEEIKHVKWYIVQELRGIDRAVPVNSATAIVITVINNRNK